MRLIKIGAKLWSVVAHFSKIGHPCPKGIK